MVVDISARAKRGGVPGDGAGVFDRQDADVEDAAAAVIGGVARQGAAADRQRALAVDATAIRGRIVRDGRVGNRQRSVKTIVDAATAIAG